ncbi:methyl-accepting chemotaxis protein [Chitiniphilus eburneus]|uniref:Methyl-accepting chemotaxis protein n=1 Tax=Chitiniphilus eburneus TaxID=2571148 RepID=A0A4U0Q1F0_9NEIS|nr:methyl-accepting chemotaxis protein [Chitiniphilus eburneus]TJZ74843.1 methyl-accepting chemotaxis protein [Chitiniphilus eburneus]
MKIGTRVRLLSAVGLIVVLLALLLTWSFIEKARVPVQNMSDNVIPTLNLLGDMNKDYAEARRDILLHVLSRDPQAMTNYEQNLNKLRDTIIQRIAEYNKTLSDETDRKNSDHLRLELDSYFARIPAILQLSNELRQDEAVQAVNTLTPQANKVFEALDTMGSHYDTLTEQSKADVTSGFATLMYSLIGVCIAAALILIITGELVTRSVVGPLFRLRNFVGNVASNYEFTGRMSDIGHDEVAETSRAFDKLLDTLQGSLRELSSIGEKVGAHAGEVATASNELSTASQKVSESTTSMAAGVEQVTVSVNHVADRAESTDEIARSAGQSAAEGGTVIGETIERINHIAGRVQDSSSYISSLVDRTANISSVVNTIKEIADQTNLLALNAAIEAARAGEMGRGFAVVADEVRKLAERTASSTAEITDTVSAIQHEANQTVDAMQRAVQEVEEGVAHAGQAGEAIQQIRQSTQSVVSEVGQISSAMREQSTASTAMAQEIEKVAQMSEETSAAALRTSEASNDLHALARDMQQVIERYKV